MSTLSMPSTKNMSLEIEYNFSDKLRRNEQQDRLIPRREAIHALVGGSHETVEPTAAPPRAIFTLLAWEQNSESSMREIVIRMLLQTLAKQLPVSDRVLLASCWQSSIMDRSL